MRIEPRRSGGFPRQLLFIAETKAESAILDEFFGKHVDDRGLISKTQAEVRLSDGVYEHYVALDAVKQ